MNKIYDCVTYFNENLQLELRFNILNKYVNKFIVCSFFLPVFNQVTTVNSITVSRIRRVFAFTWIGQKFTPTSSHYQIYVSIFINQLSSNIFASVFSICFSKVYSVIRFPISVRYASISCCRCSMSDSSSSNLFV